MDMQKMTRKIKCRLVGEDEGEQLGKLGKGRMYRKEGKG